MRCMFDRLSSDTRMSGGSSETDTNALAVIPCVRPSCGAVSTVTPLAKRPRALRNWRVSNGPMAHPRLGFSLLPDHVHVVRIDHVGDRPAVQVVFPHTLLREALVLCRLPQRIRHHQGLEPDALEVAEVIPLIQLMPAPK